MLNNLSKNLGAKFPATIHVGTPLQTLPVSMMLSWNVLNWKQDQEKVSC